MTAPIYLRDWDNVLENTLISKQARGVIPLARTYETIPAHYAALMMIGVGHSSPAPAPLPRYTTMDMIGSLIRSAADSVAKACEDCPEEEFMETHAQDPGDQNQPPSPGGDPDQGPNDLPTPRAGQDKGKDKTKNKEGFGHIGNKDVPASRGTPEPHQIF